MQIPGSLFRYRDVALVILAAVIPGGGAVLAGYHLVRFLKGRRKVKNDETQGTPGTDQPDQGSDEQAAG